MNFARRRNLFKRPGDDHSGDEEEEDAAKRLVKTKPIAQKYARNLGPDHRPRNFVNASANSAKDFYSNTQVMELEEEQKRKEAEEEEASSHLSSDEKNRLSAKILKAEMIGNNELARKLRKELESGKSSVSRERREEEVGPSSDKEVIITRTDFRTGVTVPYRSRPPTDLRAETSFTEASVKNLKELVEDEKMTTVDDTLGMIGDMATKSGASQRIDSEWTVDDVMLARKKKKKHKERDEDKRRRRAIAEQRRLDETLDTCPHCIDSKKLKKHLIVATGLKTYLGVPERESLVEGHCLILPMSHVSSSVQMDEDVYHEMKIWRKGLVALFRDRDEDCVFLETAKHVEHQPHTFIECFPLSREIGDTAPIYFKKALLECEKEWSDNKKLVDLGGKDIRRVIPKGFSYLAVDFGLQPGFAHVIEQENMIPAYFGKEILGGMMDLEHNLWRKPRKETFEEQTEKVKQMKEWWTPYDWTERAKQALRPHSDTQSDSD